MRTWIGKIVLLTGVCLMLQSSVFSQAIIVSQPSDSSICAGNSAVFNIIAVNAETYQWQEHDGAGWYDIDESITYASGEDTPDLLISDASSGLNGYKYRCKAADEFGQADTSDAAVLFVNDSPVILENPADVELCRNETAIYSVEVQNVTQYQWQENNGTGWRNLDNNAFYSGVDTEELSIYTVLGMDGYDYRCLLYNGACMIYSDEANLVVKPLPLVFTVTGGGIYCSGGPGVHIGLNGTETGTSYELLLNGNTTGQLIQGTGNAIDFGLQTAGGTYTIKAINGVTTCSNLMNGSPVVQIEELPVAYAVSGGEGYCEGSSGAVICLDESQEDVSYQLFLDGNQTNISLTGTGSSLCFENITETGFYSILGVDNISACENWMTNEVEVFIHESPLALACPDTTVVFGTPADLLGEGSGGSGAYDYFWSPENMMDTNNIPDPVTLPVTYTTVFTLKTIDQNTGCISLPDTVMVYVTDGPLTVILTATPQHVCHGDSTQLLALAGGGSGTYEYTWYSNPSGFSSAIPDPWVLPEETTTYHVLVNDGNAEVHDSITVVISQQPQFFNVTGGGYVCDSGPGVEIGLDNSQTGVVYELIDISDFPIAVQPGEDGNAISFGHFTDPGTYYVLATNGNCGVMMHGEASVISQESPQVIAGSDQFIPSGNVTQLNCLVTGGSGDNSFIWEPEAWLVDPYVQNPFTKNLTASAIFSVNTVDNVSGCVSLPDTSIVFISGGELSVELFVLYQSICEGGSTKIMALPSGGTGNYLYSWTSQPAGFTSDEMAPEVSPITDIWYYVTVDDGLSVVTDSIEITVNTPLNEFVVGGGGWICMDEGADIELSGSEPGVVYQLYKNGFPTAYTIEGTGAQIVFEQITESGLFTVSGYYTSGSCETQMPGDAMVVVTDPPTAYIVSGNPLNCIGSVAASLELSGSEAGYVYTLYRNGQETGISQAGTGLNLVFDNIQLDGTYTVYASAPTGNCSAVMNGSLEVSTAYAPEINAPQDTSICQGDTINLHVSGGDYTVWMLPSPNHSGSIIVSPEVSKVYPVLVANQSGCSKTASVSVEVFEMPDIGVEVSGNSLRVEPSGYEEYSFWHDNILLQQGMSNEFIIPASFMKGDEIVIIVSSESGCEALETYIVELNQVVNAFTPNGDNINDIFLKGSDIVVFDRWGLELYRGTEGWDGKYNGKLVAPGTYYYVQSIKDISGNLVKTLKGSVTLVRD